MLTNNQYTKMILKIKNVSLIHALVTWRERLLKLFKEH